MPQRSLWRLSADAVCLGVQLRFDEMFKAANDCGVRATIPSRRWPADYRRKIIANAASGNPESRHTFGKKSRTDFANEKTTRGHWRIRSFVGRIRGETHRLAGGPVETMKGGPDGVELTKYGNGGEKERNEKGKRASVLAR